MDATIAPERTFIQKGTEGFEYLGDVRPPRLGEFFTALRNLGTYEPNVYCANIDYTTSYHILTPVVTVEIEEAELYRVEVAFRFEVLGEELPVSELIELRDMLNTLPLDELAAVSS